MSRTYIVLACIVVILATGIETGLARKAEDPVKVIPIPQMKRSTFKYEDALDDTLVHFSFETGEEGFIAGDLTHWPTSLWHESAYNAYDERSWWCADPGLGENGGYDNFQYMTLDTDPIQLGSSSVMTCKVSIASEADACDDPTRLCAWDGGVVEISTDGGTSFEFLVPVGGYNTPCDSTWAIAFHGRHVPGGVPCWSGESGWLDAEFDLSDYDGHEVILRFSFLSDGLSSSYDDFPELIGMQVDEIEVSDNTGIIFFNDAGDSGARKTTQGDMHPGVVHKEVIWALTTVDAHSPTHSWHVDIDSYWDWSTDYIVTPWIELPSEGYPELHFWSFYDVPDADGDDDDILDDYVFIELTTPDLKFQDLNEPENMVTYYEVDATPTEWYLFDHDEAVDFGGSLKLDEYSGQQIKIRWRARSDDNHDGEDGVGWRIDDVAVTIRGAPDNDVGIEHVIAPFPHSVDRDIPVTGYIRNYGLLDQHAVIAWYFVEDADSNKVVPDNPTGPPWPSIPSGETLQWEFTYNPTDTGEYRVGFYQFIPDQFPPNDSGFSSEFRVYPEKEGLMAHYYDDGGGHIYGWDPGEGPAVLLDPPSNIKPFNILALEVYAFYAGDVLFRIYEASAPDDTIPDDGTLIAEIPGTIPEHQGGEWINIDVSEVTALQELSDPFFLWVTRQEGSPVQFVGTDNPFQPTNSYLFDNGEWERSLDESYLLRVHLEWGLSSSCQGLRGDPTGDGNINVLDVLAVANHILNVSELVGDALCRGDCTGDGIINILDALGIANVILGIIPECPGGGTCRPVVTQETMELMRSLEPHLSAENFTQIMTLVKGEIGVPLKYGLAQNYPNPFNPVTDIRYQIADTRYPIHTTLMVYNVLGQEVVTLVDEMKAPGAYTVEWDASDLASGVYFYRLTAGEYTATRQMVLMK